MGVINAMKRTKRIHKIIPVCILLAALLAIPSFAGTQEEIEETRAEQAETAGEIASTQERLAALEAQKGNDEAYLNELYSQLETLSAEFEQLESDYQAKQEELAQIRDNLAAARERQAVQYAEMKLRIQYLYESGTGTGFLEALFSSESFSEFLNKTDMVSQLTKYDRDMLTAYEETCLSIEAQEAEAVAQQEEILRLQEECTAKRQQINEIYDAVYLEMQECIANIDAAEGELAALSARLAAQDEHLQMLLIRSYEEEAAARAAAEAAAEAARNQAAAEAAAQAAAQPSESSVPAETYTPEPEYTPDPAPAPEPEPEPAQPSSPGNMRYLGTFTLTAYCNCAKCCGKWAGGNTASGKYPTANHTVAMGGVPFGTQLYINGMVYTVEDRGTPYGWVDIYFNTHGEALQFGMRSADVYIIE
ncbi:MAG: hypothetical protein IJH99_03350 [Eubacterium sp.]|nr:hypothetical protein [Eubacterium sp.]